MSTAAADTAVRTSTVVEAPAEEAFRVFTEEIGSWWNPDHHILQGELAGMIFEPRVGGHVYDRGVDGSECRWARVLAFEPPVRFVISWDINLQWQLEIDQRGRGALHPGRPGANAGRARASQPGSPRRRLGEHARRGWFPGRLAGRDEPTRRAPRRLSRRLGETSVAGSGRRRLAPPRYNEASPAILHMSSPCPSRRSRDCASRAVTACGSSAEGCSETVAST
jgi:uncharacterized protein YndB with AHSA1/START domain